MINIIPGGHYRWVGAQPESSVEPLNKKAPEVKALGFRVVNLHASTQHVNDDYTYYSGSTVTGWGRLRKLTPQTHAKP